jgi:hypothetical protein
LRVGAARTLALLAAAVTAGAQELEPRAYAPNPNGVNFVLLAYGHTGGSVVADPSLPFRDVEATVNSVALSYGRTFGLFGRSTSAGFVAPYLWGTAEGAVGEERRRVTRSGLGDARLRLSVNLIGGPALEPRAFAVRTPRTTLGMSLVAVVPSGQYDPSKLINLGANRWAMKPELGVSHPRGAWYFELYAGGWLFADNPEFFGGSRREQAPIGTLQAHVSHTFRPRLWLAGDATYYYGGRTTVDGTRNTDLQRNSRLGLTFSLPVGRRSSLKVAWATGFTTTIGGDFATLSLAWQTLWFTRSDKP